jgi:hypothetical protein
MANRKISRKAPSKGSVRKNQRGGLAAARKPKPLAKGQVKKRRGKPGAKSSVPMAIVASSGAQEAFMVGQPSANLGVGHPAACGRALLADPKDRCPISDAPSRRWWPVSPNKYVLYRWSARLIGAITLMKDVIEHAQPIFASVETEIDKWIA